MDERVMQFRVGAMVLGTLIITAILLVLFGKLPKLVGSYPVKVTFGNAGGITKGTPVRKSGMLIGRVADVQLTQDDKSVLVTLDIQTGKTIYQNEKCSTSRDLLGDTAIVFSPLKEGRHIPIDLSAKLLGESSDDPTGLKGMLDGTMTAVQGTGNALTDASKKLGKAAERVENILNDKAQDNITKILDDAAKSLEVMQKVLGDENNQKKLADAMSKLPDTFDSMNRTFAKTDEALKAFTERTGPDKKTAIERMVATIEITERRLREFSESSDPNKPAPADQIAKAVNNIGEITDLMRTIMGRIENGEGSLGALLNDRQLYDRLNKAAKNIEQVSRELRPIVEDAGVLMDKGARHPGVFIRDAVKPGIGIK